MLKKTKHLTGNIAVLDIGSAKVACIIARLTAGGLLTVTGTGHQLSKGIRSGHIVDFVEAETSVVAAVHAAEQMAGETIENVLVNVAGSGLASRRVTAELRVSGPHVSERDLADVQREAKRSVRAPETELLHCFTLGHQLDDIVHIQDPCGMAGEKLGADLHLVTIPASMVRNIRNCLAHCHLNAAEFAASPYMSGLAALEQDEMQLGVTLIDMGGGVTGTAVFQRGMPVYFDVAPVGGAHVTSDLAKGLSTSLSHAERLKTLHGSAIPTSSDEHAMVSVPQLGEEDGEDGGNLMPRSMLVGIIRPRMEEIFEMIRGKLEAAGMHEAAGRRVVLTGGASQLLGVRELATRVLGKQVRLAKPRMVPGLSESVAGPAFSTAIGMLEYAGSHPYAREYHSDQPAPPRFSVAGVTRWIKENL